jgi:hypothetical protein
MNPAGKDHVTQRDGTTEAPTPRPVAVLAAHFQPPSVEDVRQPGSWTRFLVVLWLLALVGVVAWIYVDHARECARVDAAQAQMKVIANALEVYRFAHSNYPATLEDLVRSYNTEYLDSPPYPIGIEAITTPWGCLYGYAPHDPEGPLIYCTTPSGQRLTPRFDRP